MITVLFQSHEAAATSPTGSEYNHALATNGAQATASGYTDPNVPGKAIDGLTSSVWQSSTTIGSLAVRFRSFASVNVVHAHFTTTKYTSLSLYLDTSGNGLYESGEKVWSTTQNNVLDVVVSLQSTFFALGMQITIDAKVGSTKPQINEFEAYLQGDSDGDGLTNAQETATIYYQDMSPGGLPKAIPDDGVNSTTASLSLAQFYGLPVKALANFSIDHTKRSDVTAAVGYWNGSAWIERYVWDPGRHLLSVGITSPIAGATYAGTINAVATVLHPEITTKVEFRVNGTLMANLTAPVGNAYPWSWTTSGDGVRILNATQYDTAGGKAWDQISVNVNNLGPVVTWKNPASNATVTGTVTVKVTATDYNGVQKVGYYVDNVLQQFVSTPIAGTHDYALSWGTDGWMNGVHTIKAVAYDLGALQQTTTSTRNVTTSNDPAVHITAPSAWAIVKLARTVAANASSASSSISKVEFYLDGVLQSTDTSSPYSWLWDTTNSTDDLHTLTAKAYRVSDGKAASSTITVTVYNGGGGGGGGGCRINCPTSPTLAPDGPSAPASATLGILGADWTPGEIDVGTKATVVVDLTSAASGGSAWENASRILRPALPLALFTSYLPWRLVVRDWSIGSAGSLTSYTLRFEANSDPQAMDTDSDGIGDGTEAFTWSTLPVTRDSDLDGLSDGYEIAPHTLTVWTGGVSSILAAFTTNPGLADTDGDGLTDGQERGLVTTGQSKVVGEVGLAAGITDAWTKVFLKNRYTSPVVIAQPPTQKDVATGIIRIQSITDHSFELRFQEWSAVGGHGGENVTYLVVEAGNHVLPDGTVVEAGIKSGVGTTYVPVPFREAFAQNPIVLAQIQSNADTKAAAAKIRSVGAFSFETYLRTNPLGTHATETVGYIAVAPQADSTALATWTRLAVSIGSATSGNISFPKSFGVAPMVVSWFATENSNADVSLRLSAVANASFGYARETSATPGVEILHYFAFAGPANLTARMTTRPTGTGATDTDGDGLLDGAEVNTYGSNPSLKDTDADGVPDNVEVLDRTITIPVNGTAKTFTFKTSPTSDDTDADGVKDPDELAGILDHRIAFYDMETTLADGRLRDWSGNGGHGTISGTTSVTGKVGNARSFASSNYVQASDASVVSPGMITVAAWVSISSSAGTYNPVVVKGQSGVDFQYYMDVRKVGTAWKLNVQVKNVAGTTASATSSTSITTATWTHIGFTFDGSTVRLYINGVTDATTASLSGSLRTTGQPLRIGQYYGSSLYFLGSIDEVQLWDRALALDEIAQYSAADLPVVRFDMESLRSDGKLADFAGKGNAGILFATSVVEGRIGFARNFATAASSVNVTDAASLNFNTAGLTVSTYALSSSAPASDVSLVAKKGEFYLNLSSDGLARFTMYTKAPLVSQLPLPLNRWVRVSATTDGTTMALYFDDVLMASATGFKPTDTANPITLARAEGCSPSCPRFGGSLDELVVYAKGIAQAALTKSSARGILLNPNATDTDFDGLSDGQELFVKSVKTPKRYPTRDQLWVSSDKIDLALGAPAWAIQGVRAMVGFTHEDMGQIAAWLERWTGSTDDLGVLLRQYGNAGQSNNFTSYDLLQKPSTGSQLAREDLVVAGRTWYVKAYDSTINKVGAVEYLQLQVTVHTLPNRADTDADGLNDSEEMNLGSDGFATDPWKTDTDADGWSDGYETLTKGTNPLAWDTDGDGVRDSSDLDPLHNLLVAVRVNSVHHGAGPWCTPELVGIIRVNDDYTWVSQHVVSTRDSFTSYACPPPIPTTQYATSDFGSTYYADVPDDVSSVSLRATAWAINPGRGDDILVDAFVTYTLNSGTSSSTLYNGDSWYSFDAWTLALPKANTLFVTDGNATITLASGQSRLVGQDRYYVFTFDVTSAYGPFVVGVNAVVVPRSIFLGSKLRADFDGGTFAPLANAPLYGENLSQTSVSESVSGVVALSLSGVDAVNVLYRLLR
ncbi:MAG TPA: LamG-like jellyroll fold domain-containing protein, partial [Thermoplasmata archaeon]